MFLRAGSFETRTTLPEEVAAALRRQAEILGIYDGRHRLRSGGAVLFTCGPLSSRQRAVAQQVAQRCPGLPVLIAGGAGVLTERGPLHGTSGATGLIWRGGHVQLEGIDVEPSDFPGEIQSLLASCKRPNMGLLFVRPDGYNPQTIQKLGSLSLGRQLMGGGCLGDPGVIAVSAEGQFIEARAVLMLADGAGLPRVQTCHSCRLLGSLRPITDARGATILGIDGQPALDVLAAMGNGLEGQPLLQVVLAADSNCEGSPREDWLIRGVQGIDPEARSLIVSEQPTVGQLMSFAVEDPVAAKRHLRAKCRLLSQQLAGASPLCGLYVRSARRGRQLYGKDNVDVRLISGQFQGMPLAGLTTPFEIAPAGDSSSFQVFTGVFALFSALS